MQAGQLNQLIRVSKAQGIIKRNVTENMNVAGGATATSMVPIGDVSKKVLSDMPIIRPKKNLNRKPMSETYTLLNDTDLLISSSYRTERELLKIAGLNVIEGDDVRIVKTRNGDIKSAMALHCESDGKVHSVNYIDVDKDGKYFKQGLARLATLPNSITFKSSSLDICRDDIADGLVIK